MSAETSAVPPATPIDHDEVSIRDVISVFMGGRWIILGFLILGLAGASIYNVVATPIYTADALVQVENKGSMSAALGDMAAMGGLGVETPVPAEIEILKSRTVVNKVVEELNLGLLVKPHYFPIIGEPIARRRVKATKPVDAPLGLNQFAWGGERLVIGSATLPPQLTNVTLSLIAGEGGGYTLYGPGGDEVLSGAVGKTASGDHRTGEIELFVRELQARPGTRFNVTRLAPQRSTAMVTGSLTATEKGSNSRIISLQYQHSDPTLVSVILNKLISAYQRQSVERRSAEAEQTLSFLTEQLPKVKDQVEKSEAILNKFRLQQGSADLSKETDLVLQQSVALESQRLELMQKREEAIRRFTPDHPTVQAIDAQLRQIGGRQGNVAAQVKNLPETQQELLALTRDVAVNNTLYTSLLNSFQELQIAKAGTVGNVRIVDFALTPLAPSEPKKMVSIALGLVVGLFMGIIVVLTLRALHQGVDDPVVVENKLGIPTYATIPYSERQQSLMRAIQKGAIGDKPRILAVADGENVAIEFMRGLRTSLHFAMLEARNNVIMLTGPSPGLGKSFVATNLSAVLAMSGKRVALVDLDLRRGHLHDYVAGRGTPGVTEFIVGTATLTDICQDSGIENLTLVPRGTSPPNPADLLLNERLAHLIQELSANHDYVLIDTPPILAVTDAAVIGQLAGTSMMVLKAGEHPLRAIEESVRRLRQAGIQVRGTIFNLVGMTSKYGYSYGYGHRYNYGYNYSKTYKSEKT